MIIGKSYLEPIAPTLIMSDIENIIYVGDSVDLTGVTVQESYENGCIKDCDTDKTTIPDNVIFNSTSDNTVEATYTYWNDGNKDFTVTNSIEFTVNPYTIEYNLNGGTLAEGKELTQTITNVTDTLYGEDDVSQDGYIFIGWKKVGTEYLISSFDDIKTYAENGTLSLEAVWDLESYNITYVLNGGTQEENNPTTYKFGDILTLNEPTADPTYNYNFMGW